MNKKSILIMMHCAENTGYAIASLEHVFLTAAKNAGFVDDQIFWSYKTTVSKNRPNIIECDYFDRASHGTLEKLIRDNCITTALAFDLGFPSPVLKILKESGVENIISYWGASMSSINSGLKLALKKLEYLVTRNKPNKFIFESEAMRNTATHGRGIQKSATDIIYLGIDLKRFSPEYNKFGYTSEAFKIPGSRKIVFYSGHMEERKGVRVIVQAAIHLVDRLDFCDIHFVLCGNKNNEADAYEDLLIDTKARSHVTFGGYRNDIPALMRGSHIGVIASTGWDSFTMSSVEMMASGLPLIVSNLQGLSETIEHKKNGFLIPPGDYKALALHIKTLAEDSVLAEQFSVSSRHRAEKLFSIDKQIDAFTSLFKSCI